MKNLLVPTLFFWLSLSSIAQQKVENLIIITTDGLRWQEVFSGMDSSIANNHQYNQDDSAYIFKQYWHNSPNERRKILMPFLWSTIETYGQLYGNRNYSNHVNVANRYWFSYPGYNEIFTGYPDTAINSNSLPDNPHSNVLDYINKQKKYNNKVAAFTAWNAFNHILHKSSSGYPVAAAFDTLAGTGTEKQQLINTMLLNSYQPWKKDECLDVFTHYAAMEYLKTRKPAVFYISYGETDEWAHSGKYLSYLDAARQTDKWLKDLWSYIQNEPKYKNNTALLITTDHGRGKLKNEWTSHGSKIGGSDEIWFAVLGPGITGKGEMKDVMQLYQKQFAQTIAAMLGLTFSAEHPVADAIPLN